METILLVSRSASPVVSVQEAAEHCRVTDEGEFPILSNLVAVATEAVEDYTGLVLTEAHFRWCSDRWPFVPPEAFPWYGQRPSVARRIVLGRSPLRSVQAVTYRDTLGAAVTLAPESYTVDTVNTPGGVVLKSTLELPALSEEFSPDAVAVEFTAGGSPSERARQAVLLMVSHLYDNQGVVTASNVSELPYSYQSLLAALRVS